jgi:serine acetyltransferase
VLSVGEYESIGSCKIDASARICSGAIIGKSFRPLLKGRAEERTEETTVIGQNTYVGYYVVLGAGTVLAQGAIIDDHCIVETDVYIGSGSLLIYRAQVCDDAKIGSHCVIGGFVGERVVVGDRARIFGKIVHAQHNPTVDWDAPQAREPSPVVEAGVFVGFDALVIGEVVLGTMAYVCAGAIVTRDVPERHIAYGVNKIIPFTAWKGRLGRSPFFLGSTNT